MLVLFTRILVDNVEMAKATTSQAFQQALMENNVQFILYEPSKDRQLFFKVDRANSGKIQSIFYEYLRRGLPAALDIEEAIVGLPGLSEKAQFKDISRLKRFLSFNQTGGELDFGRKLSSPTNIGIFSGKSNDKVRNENADIEPVLIAQAIKDFEKYKNSDLKTIKDMKKELAKKRLEAQGAELEDNKSESPKFNY